MTDEYKKFLSLFLCLYIQSEIRFLWRAFALLVLLFSVINDILILSFSTKSFYNRIKEIECLKCRLY